MIKTAMGIRWIKMKFKRTAMQTYYSLSISYYAAFVIQGSYLLIFTWNAFNNYIRGLFVYSIVICVPAAILLTIYMKWIDRQ